MGLRIESRYNTVCIVEQDNSIEVARLTMRPRTQEYAHLFAAAPDLYEALSEVIQIAKGPMPVARMVAILDKCLVALAKAGGVQ